jgi:poly(hydroxyalkanoate) depolymerase family esterase
MVFDRIRRTFSSAGRFKGGSLRNPAGTMAYMTYVPRSDRSRDPALVVMLHGCGQTPEDFAAGTRMNQLADHHGCVVVYPAQSAQANRMHCWNWFERRDQLRDSGEPGLIADIARHVGREHGIGGRQTFVAGLSAGGAMAVILGRAYPELFGAVGVHSGLPYRAAHDAPSALLAMQGRIRRDEKAAEHAPLMVPTIVFHGDCDATVDPGNGSAIIDQVLAADAPGSGPCKKRVEEKSSAGARRCTVTLYSRGNEPPFAEHWLVHGAGHAWSGGSALGSFTEAAGPDASAEMLRFFMARTQGNSRIACA